MGKRRFTLRFFVFGEYMDSGTIELDDAVIEAVDDEWRAQFYSLQTPEEIAAHVGYNLIVNKWPLSTLDGWADQPDKNARVIDWPDWDEELEITAGEHLNTLRERWIEDNQWNMKNSGKKSILSGKP